MKRAGGSSMHPFGNDTGEYPCKPAERSHAPEAVTCARDALVEYCERWLPRQHGPKQGFAAVTPPFPLLDTVKPVWLSR